MSHPSNGKGYPFIQRPVPPSKRKAQTISSIRKAKRDPPPPVPTRKRVTTSVEKEKTHDRPAPPSHKPKITPRTGTNSFDMTRGKTDNHSPKPPKIPERKFSGSKPALPPKVTRSRNSSNKIHTKSQSYRNQTPTSYKNTHHNSHLHHPHSNSINISTPSTSSSSSSFHGKKKSKSLGNTENTNENGVTSEKHPPKPGELFNALSRLRRSYPKYRDDDASLTFAYIRELHEERLSPHCHETKHKSMDYLNHRFFSKSSLEDEEVSLDELEKEVRYVRESYEQSIQSLSDESIFEVIKLMIEFQRQRKGTLSKFLQFRDTLDEQLFDLKGLKDYLYINGKIRSHLKCLNGLDDDTNQYKQSILNKIKNSPILSEDLFNIQEELEAIQKNFQSKMEIDRELSICLETERKYFKHAPNESKRKYFGDYNHQKKEIDQKFERHVLFFAVVSEGDELLKELYGKVLYRKIKERYEHVLKQQKERNQLNRIVQTDFRHLNLKNDRDVEKLSKLNEFLRMECLDLMNSHISEGLKYINESFVPSFRRIQWDQVSSLMNQFKARVVDELKQITEEFTNMKTELNTVYKEDEVYYGKLYEKEGNFLFRKKRLIYFGQMISEVQNGIGKEFYEDGKTVKFYGKFKKGKKHGRGEIYDRTGEMLHKGDYEDGGNQMKIYDLRKLMVDVDPVRDLLGKGSFGEVYKIKIDERIVAMKRLLLNRSNKREIDRFKNEVELLSRLKHPNVIEIIGWGEYEDGQFIQFGLIMEYCPKTIQSLYGTKFDFETKLKILGQISKGMEFLHSKDIIHRDLKFENVLLDGQNTVRIIDFGLSKQMDTYKLTNNMTKAVLGTPGYISPEILRNNQYTRKADVYAYGIMMFCLLCETDDPYDTHDNEDPFYFAKIPKLIMDDHLRPKVRENFLKTKEYMWYIDLMERCWDDDPDSRPEFSEVSEILKENLYKVSAKKESSSYENEKKSFGSSSSERRRVVSYHPNLNNPSSKLISEGLSTNNRRTVKFNNRRKY